MPYLNIGDYQFYYEATGDPAAEPLLIISGLSDYTPKCGWQTADLTADYYVIAFDNRGAGRTSMASSGYTVTDMADDAAGILDALGIQSAHVFGFSLGGMVALNLAVRYPHKVRRLIVGCTTAGGRLSIGPDEEVLESLTRPVKSGDRRQDFLDGLRFSVSDGFLIEQPELIDSLAVIAEENPQTPMGYAGQIQAVFSHDVADRLGEIVAPTLVLHGIDDRVIPVQNGRLLAEYINNAQLILYPEAGHLFFIERAADVNRDIRAFFR